MASLLSPGLGELHPGAALRCTFPLRVYSLAGLDARGLRDLRDVRDLADDVQWLLPSQDLGRDDPRPLAGHARHGPLSLRSAGQVREAAAGPAHDAEARLQ